MADKSAIEWTDATWNPIVGCSVVSPGCAHCYAMRFAGARLAHLPLYDGLTQASKAGPVWTGALRMNEKALDTPLRWKKPRRIFVNSMGDLFHEDVPDEWIDRVFAVMRFAPQHIFQVLTKRALRMRAYIESYPSRMRAAGLPVTEEPFCWPLENVWIGVSAEDQTRWDERVPHLLAAPAAVRFVSAEPLLDRIEPNMCDLMCIDWLIVGGESGRGARPMHPDWARNLRESCAVTGTAFFFKQWGEWAPIEPPQSDDDFGPGARLIDGQWMRRDGKKAAGRVLDDREHNAFPVTAGK